LTYPPNGIADEFETSGFVKFFCGLNQSQISFVDQIRQTEALVLVLFRNRYDETKIGTGKFFQCLSVASFNCLRQFHFFFYGN
jgi:hypothetical protein